MPSSNIDLRAGRLIGIIRALGDQTMKYCLVVDDSAVIRKVARRILEGPAIPASPEAEDGARAIDACKGEMPDAVLLDWNMPIMDGYDFLRTLRQMPGGKKPKSCSAPPRTTSPISRGPCMPAPTSTS